MLLKKLVLTAPLPIRTAGVPRDKNEARSPGPQLKLFEGGRLAPPSLARRLERVGRRVAETGRSGERPATDVGLAVGSVEIPYRGDAYAPSERRGRRRRDRLPTSESRATVRADPGVVAALPNGGDERALTRVGLYG